MTKEARVWKTYVWETDRWDKELVGGRNRFVLVSVADLKPDYTESSAQTLLAISQMLSAQANPQNASLVAPGPSDTPSFSPSRTAVLVNSLWMLSLSLSVAVSLIAMLAKDWCYKFTSSRSGPAYEQARRRQRKWNGIKKWKMNEVLTYLPGMLHLALLLFAGGMCLYLWDINITVAIPVVIVTGSAALLYTLVTILPYIDRSCPYSTPASGIFTALNKILTLILTLITKILDYALTPVITIIRVLVVVIGFIPGTIYLTIFTELPSCVDHWIFQLVWGLPIWIRKQCKKTFNALPELLESPIRFLRNIFSDELDGAYDGKDKVPADILTSQMLAWLISNCEDSRSVDTALQAIAGANHNLPHQPLKDCGVFGLVSTRLDAYIERDTKSKKYTVKDASQLLIALIYCRTYSILMFGATHQANKDGQSAFYEKVIQPNHAGAGVLAIHSLYTEYVVLLLPILGTKADRPRVSLLEQAESRGMDPDVIATAAAVAMPFSDLEWQSESDRSSLAPETASSVLAKHFQSDCTMLSTSSLIALADFVPHYLLWAWSRWGQADLQRPQHLLPMMLAQLFFRYYSTEPELARSSAIALATTAFAANNYDGGERPPKWLGDRKRRAAQVLQHYQSNPPDTDTVLPLFIFGFYQLLPRLNFDLIDQYLPGLLDHLNILLGFPRFNLKDNQILPIFTIPSRHSLERYVLQPALKNLVSFVKGTSNDADHITAFKLSPLLIHAPESAKDTDPGIYGLALISLCRAKDAVLQDLCMNVIDEQSIPASLAPVRLDNMELMSPWERVKAEAVLKEAAEEAAEAVKKSADPLGQLCGALMANETHLVHVAILHFELLVACIVSAEALPLETLQSALLPLLSSHGEFAGLKGSGPLSLEELFSDLEKRKTERRTRDSVLRMMQYVADFCGHGLPSPDKNPGGASGGGANSTGQAGQEKHAKQEKQTRQEKQEEQARVDWYARLVELKNAYKLSAETVERPKPGDAGGPSTSNRGGVVDQEAGTPFHGITQTQPAMVHGVMTRTGNE
ncbi:hypothetical protein FRC10_009218 [Ceratobasidium sp. 414]|nr:hypothetical protein FRC10_009218 [Ceratobasidium sp. 414]